MQLNVPRHLALFLPALQGGGAERVVLDLARAFSQSGHLVDLVLSRLRGELVSDVPDSVRIVELGTPRPAISILSLLRLPVDTWSAILPALARKPLKKVRSLPRLERYLVEERPDVLMASTDIPNLLALWAARLARAETRVFVKQDISLAQRVKKATSPLERKLPRLIRRWYPRADGIIAVSAGVADELVQVADVPREKIRVIYNPVDLRRIATLAAEAIDDPWFRPGEPPVLVAAGRLHKQKDYPTLFRAFSRARARTKLRLVILGEGEERPQLEALSRELGLSEDVRLLGFQRNPYAYMARATAFVLSSVYEGLPTVLIEALACGCRVVSTDCPTGPSELLEGGRYGRLVPVADDAALAEGILATLHAPRSAEQLRRKAESFSIETVADSYLRLLLSTRSSPSRDHGDVQ